MGEGLRILKHSVARYNVTREGFVNLNDLTTNFYPAASSVRVINFTCLASFAPHLVEKGSVSKFSSYRKSFEVDLK